MKWGKFNFVFFHYHQLVSAEANFFNEKGPVKKLVKTAETEAVIAVKSNSEILNQKNGQTEYS